MLLLSFITPNGSTEKNTIIYTKYKNKFTKQNIKTDYKLKLQFIQTDTVTKRTDGV